MRQTCLDTDEEDGDDDEKKGDDDDDDGHALILIINGCFIPASLYLVNSFVFQLLSLSLSLSPWCLVSCDIQSRHLSSPSLLHSLSFLSHPRGIISRFF